jgi:tetratricopeptide (TPR) repeat protein
MRSPVQHVEQKKFVSASKKGIHAVCPFFPDIHTTKRCLLPFLVVIVLFVISPSWAAQDWEKESKNALLQENWSRVGEIATQWKTSDTRTATADWLLGYASLARGDYSRATEGFSRLDSHVKVSELEAFAAGLIKENPQSAVAFMLHGDALARLRKYDEALTLLNNASSLDPRSALILNTRGVVKVLANRP